VLHCPHHTEAPKIGTAGAQKRRNLKPLLIGVATFAVVIAGILTAMLILSHCTGSDDTRVFVKRISTGQQVRVSGGSFKTIAFTDFAFFVKFNGTVASGDGVNTLQTHIRTGDILCDGLATVQVFAQEGTLEEFHRQRFDYFSFPESNPSNELSMELEILDHARILVSSTSGNFPAASQIVLILRWGENLGYVARLFTASSPP